MITSIEFLSFIHKAANHSFRAIPPIFYSEDHGEEDAAGSFCQKEEVIKVVIKEDVITVPYPVYLTELFATDKYSGRRIQIWQAIFAPEVCPFPVASSLSHGFCSLFIHSSGNPETIFATGMKFENGEFKYLPSLVSMNVKTNEVKDRKLSKEETGRNSNLFVISNIDFSVRLLYELFNGQKHAIKRIPQIPGKSVHWTESRSRIVLIDNREASELQHKAGVKLTAEEKEQQTRAAHSRRGHSRLLSAPRYKANVGKRVFVKACWVGPKEWMDTAGQTLYKLVEQA